MRNKFALASEEHKVTVKYTSADKPLVANVDRLLMGRVIHNLLANAIKYSPAGRIVTIKSTSSDSDWTISVHNDGPGIQKADQEKIFQGFYRTKEAQTSGQKGTGMGLMLCQEIVQRHGGKLELETAPNKGCTFSIIVPK